MTNDIYKLFITFALFTSLFELYCISKYQDDQIYCEITNFTILEHNKYYHSCPLFFWKNAYNVTDYTIKFDVCHIQKNNALLFPIFSKECNKTLVDSYGIDYSTYRWNTTSILLQYINLYMPIGSKFHYTRCV